LFDRPNDRQQHRDHAIAKQRSRYSPSRQIPLRRSASATCAAFASSAVCGTARWGVSLASATGGGGDREFVLIERQVSQHFVDLGAAGLSVGDHAVFRSVFTTPRGAKAGDVNVVCTLVSKTAAHCAATATLHGGTLELSGLLNITSPDVQLAIIGGTGAFDRARGQLSSHHLHGDVSRDTFDLDS
jgi:allene oxide cyclase-like protein